jgi:molecular chaperone HtpG
MTTQTLGFQTEVKQLLDLVIHSLYSNKDIFLRELVSNASDALDKLKLHKMANSQFGGSEAGDYEIHVDFDEAAGTITVRDNGIGMSREEAIDHLGTIAKSGTKEFLGKLTGDQRQDEQLIGQFGVGFYSGFIIADKIRVESRRADLPADQGVAWESAGSGDYTVSDINKPTRGTHVILYVKDEAKEYLNNYRLRNIIQHYSDHISWPIKMLQEVREPVKEEGETEAKPAPTPEYETVNKATALWTRGKNDISDEEYNEFYKHISHDFANPLAHSHNRVEGKQDYTTLLFIPERAPFDLWHQDSKSGLKLFVKRVFIMDDASQFLPRYLRFIKGIVDANDLPLNVSREILQDNKLVETIRTGITKRVLGVLEKMASSEPEKYATFWKQFGNVMKEGVIEDYANKDAIAKLLRFTTTQSTTDTQDISLDEYVARMPENQEKIFYITGESFMAVKNSPHLEIFRKKGIEVLLLWDRIDEWVVSNLSEFSGKHLQSITKGDLDLGKLADEEDTKHIEEEKNEFDSVLKQIQDILKEEIKEARITHRLTDSPACVVADTHDMGREMQRILEAAGQKMPASKPIFEINPTHPLVQRLKNETDDAKFGEWTHILFDQALLAEGTHLQNPAQFVGRLNKLLLELS